MGHTYDDGEVVEKDGLRFRIDIKPDEDTGAPWDEGDGNGIVSEWTNRAKKPGELILSSACRGSKHYYDWAGTIVKARNEGWGLSDVERMKLSTGLGRDPTPGEITVLAVQRDF